MKSFVPVLLLLTLSVSCGNKNKSGGGGSVQSGSEPVSNVTTNLNNEQERNFIRSYKTAAKEVLEKNRRKIGNQNYNLIKARLKEVQIKLDYNAFGSETFSVTNTFYDGYSLTLYVGDQYRELNWRRLLRNRTARVDLMLYEDLLSLRGTGAYSYSSSSFSYGRTHHHENGRFRRYDYSNSRNGGRSSFYYEFRIK